MSPTMLLTPKVAFLAGAAVAVASPRVRRLIGQGLGYGVGGARKAGGAVVETGSDIYGSARETAAGRSDGQAPKRKRAAATA
jgi:hypothetical protein